MLALLQAPEKIAHLTNSESKDGCDMILNLSEILKSILHSIQTLFLTYFCGIACVLETTTIRILMLMLTLILLLLLITKGVLGVNDLGQLVTWDSADCYMIYLVYILEHLQLLSYVLAQSQG